MKNLLSEEEQFKWFSSRDPNPGEKNRILYKDKHFEFPDWVRDGEVKKTSSLKIKGGVIISSRVLYDVLVLGLEKFDDERPKCPVCGKPCKYKDIRIGYSKTCGDLKCINESIKNTVTKLWEDEDYQKLQTESHVAWASIEENRALMSERSAKAWQNEEYRSHQSEVHKKWAKNNPNKVGLGDCYLTGYEHSNKSGKDLKYDSSWEQKVIAGCNDIDEVISINRADMYIEYQLDNITRHYFPDFRIELSSGLILLVEIKADHKMKEEATILKIRAAKEYVKRSDNDFDKYLVLTSKDLFDDKSFKIFNLERLKKALLQENE